MPAIPGIHDMREPALPMHATGRPPAPVDMALPPPPAYVAPPQRAQWLQGFHDPSMQAARALLRLDSLLHLTSRIDYHAISANAHRIGAYAAFLLQAPQEDIESRAVLQRQSMIELHAIGTMLTISSWTLENKLAGLRHLLQRVEREGGHLGNYTFLGDGYLHLLCRSRLAPDDVWTLARFFVTEAGLDCNRPNASGHLAAHLLVRQAESGVPLFYFLGAGTDPNLADAGGYSLMHHVARRTKGRSILNMCAMAGGDLHLTTPRNETLLHMSLTYQDDPDMVQYLVAHGVSPHTVDSTGLDAFDYATMMGRTQALLYLGTRPAEDAVALPSPPDNFLDDVDLY